MEVMTPKQNSGIKNPRHCIISNQSTPIVQRTSYNEMNKNKNQTTAMKRRKKRDPTICRKGIEGMDPYTLIKDESLEW
jgi:hypothetical protein